MAGLSEDLEGANDAACEDYGTEPVDAPATGCAQGGGGLLAKIKGGMRTAREKMREAMATAKQKVEDFKNSPEGQELQRMKEHASLITPAAVYGYFMDAILSHSVDKVTEESPESSSP